MNARFENYAREQLSNHQVEVDAEALWANIYPEVKKDKRGKRGLWIFLSGLLIGLLGFGVFYFNQNTTTPSVDDSLTSIATSTLHQSNESNQPTSNNSTISTALAADLNDSDSNASTTAFNKADEKSPAINTETNSTVKTTKEASNFKNSNSNSNSDLYRTNIESSLPSNELADRTTASGNEKPIDPYLISFPVRNEQAVNHLATLQPSFFDIRNDNGLTAIKSYKDQLLVNFLEEAKKEEAKKKKPRRNSFTRDMKVGVGLYTGISSSSSELEAKDEFTQDYLLMRTNSEDQLETLHFGLNALIYKEIFDGDEVYLRTGIEYSRIASKFSRNATQVEMDTTVGIVEYQINSITGDTTFIEGPVIVTRTTSFTKKTYNYFHLVDVPIIFGFNFGNDPWTIGVEGGIFANVYMKRKGEISLPDDTFYDIAEDRNEWFEDNIGISPFLGINAAYNVSDNIRIHVSPSFRFNAVYSTDKNPIKEEHGTLGIRAGVRYLFD